MHASTGHMLDTWKVEVQCQTLSMSDSSHRGLCFSSMVLTGLKTVILETLHMCVCVRQVCLCVYVCTCECVCVCVCVN